MPLHSELLFYGGIAILSLSLIAAIVFICCYKIRSRRLNSKLNEEYGEKKK